MQPLPSMEDQLDQLRAAEKDYRTLLLLASLELLEAVEREELKRLVIQSEWYLKNKDYYLGFHDYLGYKL